MFRGERKIPKKRGFELAREALAAISTLGQMHCPKKTARYSINFLSANAMAKLSMSPRVPQVCENCRTPLHPAVVRPRIRALGPRSENQCRMKRPLPMTRSNFGVRLKRPARSITAKEDPAAENLKASGVRPAAQVVAIARFSNTAHQRQNDYDNKNKPKLSARIIAPSRAVRPVWQRSDQ